MPVSVNKGILGLYTFIRDLLNQPEGTVMILGRNNLRRDDFKELQIVVDSLSPAVLLGRGEQYDGDLEELTHSQRYQVPCTVDFYGDDAYTQAMQFALLLQSQAGYELQRDGFIRVFDISTVTDVKSLTGSQYSQRHQITVNVMYNESITLNVLRIDTLQSTLIVD